LIEAEVPGSVAEHVGSTAVAGLGGKGVIDLALIYPSGGLVAARDAVDQLGFQRQRTRDPFPEERPMRVGSVDWHGKRYRLHVHVITAESAEVDDLLSFRDSLRRDVGLCEAYANLKREILGTGVTDSLDYWKAKSAFFVSMDAKRSSHDRWHPQGEAVCPAGQGPPDAPSAGRGSCGGKRGNFLGW
jgi:GrpB-like predicted nucleotidyltransferase (UPF0157 family)